MNAEEALRIIRTAITDQELAESDSQAAAHGWQAADAFRWLDEWLSRGGTLPLDWAIDPNVVGMDDRK